MSTRCNIHFCYGPDDVQANVYRHYDSYPDEGGFGVLPDLEKFFDDVQAQAGRDTRFSDPEYLAARFVVWQAAQNARDSAKPLAFTGIGITLQDAGDGEYVYTVICNSAERPSVSWRTAE